MRKEDTTKARELLIAELLEEANQFKRFEQFCKSLPTVAERPNSPNHPKPIFISSSNIETVIERKHKKCQVQNRK